MSLADKYSRRVLLKRLGLGMGVLPLLESEWAEAATCAGTSGPRRAFFIAWANGMISKVSTWAPPGPNFVLPPFMAAYEPHRKELNLLDGLDYKFLRASPNTEGGEITGHSCFQGMLTGALYKSFSSTTAGHVANGPSIDQHIGTKLKAAGYKGLTSLNTQVYSRSTARLSWRAASDPVIPDADPFHVYQTLFGTAPTGTAMPTPTTPTTPTMPAPTPTTPAVDKMLLMRKSILDHVLSDINRFSGTVGAADRIRIEAHLTSVRDIESRLSNQINGMPMGGGTMTTTPPPPGMACAAPAIGAKGSTNVQDTKHFEAITKMQIDLAVAALAADMTRVVVLQLGCQGDPDIILTTLGFVKGPANLADSTGDYNGYHAIAHRNGEEKVKCDTWFHGSVAYAIGAMKNVADADKTLLDNSVLVAMNNMRDGMHAFVGVPAVMAGSCGGYFKTGQSLKLTSVANNAVLCSVANALGVPTPTFGHAEFGGELADIKA